MNRKINRITVGVFIAAGIALTSVSQAETVLKARTSFRVARVTCATRWCR